MSPGITPAFSLLRAHAPDLNPLTASVLTLYPESLQVAACPCWKEAVPGVISANLSPRFLDPYPGRPCGARARYFPLGVGLPPFLTRSALNKSRTTTSVRSLVFEAAVIHSCSGPQVCSPPRSFPPPGWPLDPPRGSRDFYVHAELGSLPPRAVDRLSVRIEQLTAEGLSPPKIRGLAGRS